MAKTLEKYTFLIKKSLEFILEIFNVFFNILFHSYDTNELHVSYFIHLVSKKQIKKTYYIILCHDSVQSIYMPKEKFQFYPNREIENFFSHNQLDKIMSNLNK